MPFYYRKMLNSKVSTAALIVPVDNCGGGSGAKATLPNGYEFKTILTDDLNLTNNNTWGLGGDLITAFKSGMVQGVNSAKETYTSARNTIAHAYGSATNTLGQTTASTIGKLITADDAFKKYDGSKITISIPTLNFFFIATDNGRSHLTEAQKLLYRVLPEISSEGIQSESTRYELPPNKYATLNSGFDPNGLKGYFNLRLGHRLIKYVLPETVTINCSRQVNMNNYPLKVTIGLSFCVAYKYTSKDAVEMLN